MAVLRSLMATKRPLRGQALKSFRTDVARLKKKGLVSKRVDARSQRPTRYMREQVKKYDDVLKGRAAVVKTPRASDARGYAERYKTKFNKIVVPKASKSDRITFNPRTGEIVAHRREYDRKIKRIMPRKRLTSQADFPTVPAGKRHYYSVPFQWGSAVHRQRFEDKGELFRFMSQYDRYKNWLDYVEIEELDQDADIDPEELSDDE